MIKIEDEREFLDIDFYNSNNGYGNNIVKFLFELDKCMLLRNNKLAFEKKLTELYFKKYNLSLIGEDEYKEIMHYIDDY